MSTEGYNVWLIIGAMAVGTYLIRFSFVGFLGDRPLPPAVLRLLRYAPVAILPGMVAPLVLWPAATGGTPDPARLAAAAVAFVVGYVWKNVIAALAAGSVTLYSLIALTTSS